MEVDIKSECHTYRNYHDAMSDDFSETFTISLSPLIEELDRQRLDKTFCDIELIAEDKVYLAHRCVLAATTPYFKGNICVALFTH